MAKAKHTYAIRLSVDGGGKVKAELMDVGRAGDKSLKKIEKAGGKASLGLTRLSDRAQALGRNMKFLYGAIAAAGAIRGLQEMVKLYADFEAGLIGVGKTANLSKAELASLGQDIDALSKRIPVATDELLAIAQSAGQLGVKGAANILKFTETVAKLGTATDLSGNDAAMALARILNVTGETMDTVDVLGSAIVKNTARAGEPCRSVGHSPQPCQPRDRKRHGPERGSGKGIRKPEQPDGADVEQHQVPGPIHR